MAKNIDNQSDFQIKISPTAIIPVHVYSLIKLQSKCLQGFGMRVKKIPLLEIHGQSHIYTSHLLTVHELI